MINVNSQLIYLFVGEVNRCIRNQGICFGNNFEVTYELGKRHLYISQCSKKRKSIYGNNISSIDVIVGRNGCGKSTMIDILGLAKQDRNAEFPIAFDESIKCTWFALYHLGDDSFAIEGYWDEMIDFLSSAKMYLQPQYSVGFKYDLTTQSPIGDILPLQEYIYPTGNKTNIHAHECLSYLLYQTQPAVSWYSSTRRSSSFDSGHDFLFSRQYAGKAGYREVTQYLYDSIHSKKFSQKISSVPGAHISIELVRQQKSMFVTNSSNNSINDEQLGEKAVSSLIYGETEELLHPTNTYISKMFNIKQEFTHSQKMVIMYLEELVCHLIANGIKPNTAEYVKQDPDYMYSYRKQYLLDMLMTMLPNALNSLDYYLATNIVEGLEQIPYHFFTEDNKVEIDIKDMYSNFLDQLMMTLNYDSANENHEINHQFYIRPKFTGLSSGEAHFLNLYASLHWGINVHHLEQGSHCILLLDEPDECFHPEWSRQFIENLVALLKTCEFSKFSYQIIITTHSPLMLSDVPRENIHCLKQKQGGHISLLPSSYGFMSNITDILMDSFFTDSIFGSFSENYVNEIISRIEKWEKNPHDISMQYINDLKEEIEIIEEVIIRESILHRINRLEHIIKETRNDKNTYRQ